MVNDPQCFLTILVLYFFNFLYSFVKLDLFIQEKNETFTSVIKEVNNITGMLEPKTNASIIAQSFSRLLPIFLFKRISFLNKTKPRVNLDYSNLSIQVQ